MGVKNRQRVGGGVNWIRAVCISVKASGMFFNSVGKLV